MSKGYKTVCIEAYIIIGKPTVHLTKKNEYSKRKIVHAKDHLLTQT